MNTNNTNNRKSTKNTKTNNSSGASSSGTLNSVSLEIHPLDFENELDVILEDTVLDEEIHDDRHSEEEVPAADKVEGLLQLTKEDVAGEIEYWSTAVFCYVLGANPPSTVINGFVKRVWKAYGVEMISFLPNGIFLVRFDTKEHQQTVVSNGHLLFDSKPVIVKEWSPDTELIKHDVKVVPVWMKLFGLDVKFWGNDCLVKIGGLVGKFIRSDAATSRKAFLRYARVLIEVRVDQAFPEELKFLDENGKLQILRVEYDWLPITCANCKGMGHNKDQCRRNAQRGMVKRVWRPKVVVPTQPQPQPVVPATPAPVVAPPATGTVATGEASFPRRIIARMLRNESGTSRVYTPGGLSFMDALNLSIHKGRGDVVINERVIHAKVWDKVRNKRFWFSLVYGLNKHEERESLWRNLKRYAGYVNGVWAVCGDFNSLLGLHERIGGNEVTNTENASFREVANVCQLHDLNAVGSFFTWNNKHEASTKIYSKIDRFVVNVQWLDSFPESFANFLPEGLFDHCPCVGKLEFGGARLSYVRLVHKLKRLKHPLRCLNKEQFNDIENPSHVATLHFQHYQRLLVDDPLNQDLCDAERQAAKELAKLSRARSVFLMQKVKDLWMEDGDENTYFFHASIKRRRMRNRVYQIHYVNNRLCTSPDQIREAFEDYYISLLGDAKPVSPIHRRVVQAGPCVTQEHVGILNAERSDEEIKNAMFDILDIKAPGPDGYSSQFFKDSWDIVGNDVISAIKNVFSSGQILKQCNNTILTLGPKVICNRLGRVLPALINPSQSAFIKGRDIVGNILICQDLVKLYKRKCCSPRVLLKLDLQKACDSIEWSFVLDMLDALGFPERFVRLIEQCITTPSYSIALNGEVFGFFRGKRGLRQGDPLSPLLFTVCLEYLSRILMTLQKHEKFRFHLMCKALGLSHLCFADDLLLFCKGGANSVLLMIRAFETFSKASGLKMSLGKSSIYSNGVAENLIERMATGLGIQRGRVPFKYLGVNISPKKLSVTDCDCLIEKVTERIRALGARHLSYAGRVVLIRSFLLSLQYYRARIFILPKIVMNKIEGLCRSFLWHGSGASNGPTLVSWEQICKPRKNGGLGFVRLHQWNVASLGKYAWWVQMKVDHLWVRWVHAVYLKGQSWSDYVPGSGSSWGWRKLCWVRDLLNMVQVGGMVTDEYSTAAVYARLVDQSSRMVGCLLRIVLSAWALLVATVVFFCGDKDESHDHIFFECEYSRKCVMLLSRWLGVQIPVRGTLGWWLRLRTRSLAMKQILGLAIAGLLYRLWWARNTARIESFVPLPRILYNDSRHDILTRVRVCNFTVVCSRVRLWVDDLQKRVCLALDRGL
ncbi:hypothetical protein RND81_02G097200 [Saponaria officinalis]|uniref:Reverse transcriptase domain-containing protein n=1 Tax=Saponaria officinalis TaxID=3572 RepID=A0AAW1ML10_SAPOF